MGLNFELVCAEKYLQQCWPEVKGALKEHGIACELNLVSFIVGGDV